MHIKRFEAATMEDALAEVKKVLGNDALILSTRTHRKGAGVLGFMARQIVEVQAAAPQRADGRGSTGPRSAAVDSKRASSEGGPPPVDANRSLASSIARLESSVGALRAELAGISRGRDFEDDVRGELEALRGLIYRQSATGGEFRRGHEVEELLRFGLEVNAAESIASEFLDPSSASSTRSVETLMRDRIRSLLTPPRSEERPPLRVLVGAPGVGKTTTLAKLAARNECGEREVTLVSMDPYRIGAEEQLRRYADFLDSPFFAGSDASQIHDFAKRYPSHDVFVDTAGRSRRDDWGLDALAALRKSPHRPVSIELVVDASTSFDVQRLQLERFSALQLDRLILTKVDECGSLAASLNLLLSPGCPPLSWLGNGQRVPEDLAIAEVSDLFPATLPRAL